MMRKRVLFGVSITAAVLAAAGWVAVLGAQAASPAPTAGRAAGQGGQGARGGAPQAPAAPAGGGPGANLGPDDKPAVDPAAADRGRTVWASECINCHGSQARGTDTAPNLVRSVLVLHDRAGNELGPFLQKGHRLQSGRPGSSLTTEQIQDVAQFLRQRVNDGLRSSPTFRAQNVLVGDVKAGETFFNGAGNCKSCHSPTGDMAGAGARYDAVTLQQRFLFPNVGGRGGARFGGAGGAVSPTAVTVKVTPATGPALSGVMVQMDDFTVTLREASGTVRTFRRGPTVKVEKTVPLAAHYALLDTITDAQIHDVVAYLETLK
ncbi:MAG: c-type cytochrome [Vicinamibacterales bacterium]